MLTSFIHTILLFSLCFCNNSLYDLSTNISARTGEDGNKTVRGLVGMGLKSCPRADL